ncbi:hypothetical protein [Celeribacter sp.]|uniref:hypothetical protein n=1 Tax=Celeribacter sp. TaxID=1890673 RepID=UPI003A9476C7
MTNDHLPEDLTPDDMEAIAKERQRFMTRRFWVSLLKGQEPLGDTFWAGNYLAALYFLPVMIFLLALGSFVPALSVLLSMSFVIFGIYILGVARAVAVAKPKGQAVKGWRIVGVTWTLLNAATLLTYAPFAAGQ